MQKLSALLAVLAIAASVVALNPTEVDVNSLQLVVLRNILQGFGLSPNVQHRSFAVAGKCFHANAYWQRNSSLSDIPSGINSVFVNAEPHNQLGYELCHPGIDCEDTLKTYGVGTLINQTTNYHNGVCCQADGRIRMM